MKKEKKGRLSSRRKRSLRRVLIAAAAVLLVNRIFLIGLLFPIQALRHIEERQGTGRTAVICRDWAPEIHGSHLLYLTENEKVLMLSGTYLTVYGWMDAFGVAADCTPPRPHPRRLVEYGPGGADQLGLRLLPAGGPGDRSLGGSGGI